METNNIVVEPKKTNKLIIVVIILVVIGLGIGGYYAYKSLIKDSSDDVDKTTQVSTGNVVAEVASTEEIASDLESVNVEELKQAVTELKETISSFSQ